MAASSKGYKKHRPGSRKEKVHKFFDGTKGDISARRLATAKFAKKLGIAAGTVASWSTQFAHWTKTLRQQAQARKDMAEAKALLAAKKAKGSKVAKKSTARRKPVAATRKARKVRPASRRPAKARKAAPAARRPIKRERLAG